MTETLQMSRYRGPHVTAVPSDQNTHTSMIIQRQAADPPIFFLVGSCTSYRSCITRNNK
jgi:hypothetical protein